MKRKLLLFLTLLLSFWSCEKVNDEDIVPVHDDPPQLSVGAQSDTISYNTFGIIPYNVKGEVDSLIINNQRVYLLPSGSYSTGNLKCDSIFVVSAYGPGGKDEKTVKFTVIKPQPSFSSSISSYEVEYDGTVTITCTGSYIVKFMINGVRSPIPSSTNVKLTEDTDFKLEAITIYGDTIKRTYVVEVGEKPTWRTFLEIGLGVKWKLFQVYRKLNNSGEWTLSTASNDDYQIIFMSDGSVQSYWTGMPWGYGGTWTLSGNILNFQGNAQIQEINQDELVLYYEKRPILTDNGQIEIPYLFIYKKL